MKLVIKPDVIKKEIKWISLAKVLSKVISHHDIVLKILPFAHPYYTSA